MTRGQRILSEWKADAPESSARHQLESWEEESLVRRIDGALMQEVINEIDYQEKLWKED